MLYLVKVDTLSCHLFLINEDKYIENGMFFLDNNFAEDIARPFPLGRKARRLKGHPRGVKGLSQNNLVF